MRWLTPIFFVAATAGVRWYNDTHGSSQLVFPGSWLVPGAEHDIAAQGQWSWRALAFVTLVMALWTAIDQVRAWRRRDEQAAKP